MSLFRFPFPFRFFVSSPPPQRGTGQIKSISLHLGLCLSLCLIFLLGCTSPPTVKPLIAKGEIRFLADQRQLKGEISLFQGDSLSSSLVLRPEAGSVAFMGSAMQADELATRQRWRADMKTDFPEELRFTFPASEKEDAARMTLPISFTPPFTDSLPPVINRQKSLRFPAGSQALGAHENIVVFFEPVERSKAPRRIVVAGPTTNEKITLPSATLSDLEAGEYQVYFVKQQLARDTIDHLTSAIQVGYHTRSKKLVVR